MSGVSTRQVYGMDVAGGSSQLGNVPPFLDVNMVATGSYTNILNTAESLSAAVILKFTGTSANVTSIKVVNGVSRNSFDMVKWKLKMDAAGAVMVSATMDGYIRSGAAMAHYMLDDIKSGNEVFYYGPSFLDLEEMARYSKTFFPNLPCCVRAENQYLKTLALADASTSSYSWMDFGWAQWSDRLGAPNTWFTNHINDGKAMRLGAMVGFNILNGGSGDVAPWNIHPGSSHLYGMSPTECDTLGEAYSAHISDVIGIMGWSANPTFDHIDYYGSYTGIPQAMAALSNRAIGRTRGPINQHTAATPPGTVVGEWAIRDDGSHLRANNPSSMNFPAPSAEVGDLLCLLAYSRDSGLSAVRPSSWSEVARMSGHSARGGDLALFTKVADGTEGTTITVSFNGSATNTACQGQCWAMSGQTTAAAYVDTVSKSSWPQGSSNMGPVKGQTSSSSDVAVFICAAKTNDFNNGDPPDFTTMSSTTHDNESWTRLLMSTNVSGDDSGLFVDYAFINGKQSITTKSWTQGTGAGSNASGAGCGFMVSFKPAVISSVAVNPPALVEVAPLDDLTGSLGDTLGFQFTALAGTAPLTWSMASAPSNFTLDSSAASAIWTPLAAGTYYMIVQATNAAGSDSDDFFVQISAAATGSNHTPVITNPGNMTVHQQQRTTFTVTATDQDGDSLTYSLDAGSPADASIDATTGFFDYTPQTAGTYPVVVLVSDGFSVSRSTFTFTVVDNPWTTVLGPHLTPPTNQFRRL